MRSYVLACLLATATTLVAAKDLSSLLTKEAAAVKQPIEEAIISVASSQCDNVKKLTGVSYTQIEGEKEPDVENLTLIFKSNSFETTYRISAAGYLIPRTKEINFKQKLYLYIHGFTDSPSGNSFGNISEAFLARGNYNILAVDASSLLRWLYLRSTTYVRFIGEKLGEVLAAMVENGVDPADINVIGHSLGGHISGFTGKTFTNLTGQKVGRITGLDPAGPCFTNVEPDLRLKKTDADFVDIIHTDTGAYGLRDTIGHVDYFPNSGTLQPECFLQTCSHSRAWLYYAESVLRPKAFPAVQCEDWDQFKNGTCSDEISYMGFETNSTTRGQYYLRTAGEAPYGLEEKGLKYKGGEALVTKVVNGLF